MEMFQIPAKSEFETGVSQEFFSGFALADVFA